MSENSKTIKRNFVCPKNVSRYLFCAICNEIFNSPVRIKECGHTFCRKCIKNWGKLHASCPFCRTAFNPKNLKKDIIAHNIINDLDVFCEYKNCPWKGVLRQLRKHIKTCNFKPSSISDAIKNAIDPKKSYKNDENVNNDQCNVTSNITLNRNNNTNLNFQENEEDNCNNETIGNNKFIMDEEAEEKRETIDNLTSFNTRVGLKARVFNKNKQLVSTVIENNNVNKNDEKKKYHEDSIFSFLQENDIQF